QGVPRSHLTGRSFRACDPSPIRFRAFSARLSAYGVARRRDTLGDSRRARRRSPSDYPIARSSRSTMAIDPRGPALPAVEVRMLGRKRADSSPGASAHISNHSFSDLATRGAGAEKHHSLWLLQPCDAEHSSRRGGVLRASMENPQEAQL